MNTTRMLIGWAVLVWGPLRCLAQVAGDPHSAPSLEAGAPWVAILYGAVFTLAIAVVAFKNPKRSMA